MNREELANRVEEFILDTLDYEVLYDEDGSKVFIGDYIRSLCNGVRNIIENKES